ncbi:ACP S-malonyltransferase [Aquimarina sp. I32.4]|uniref:ACP S-malonyltransferase n=1 Tax=Aquimarina sp. I32.4 TaxID=2053903 RepID=UPI0018EC5EDD|nr:ACP S-malonyltransferase [Aquimarina sp. I32.4]
MKKVIMFPGQGSQYRGMGKDLFKSYKNKVIRASDILGYDLEELCLKDPNKELSKTQFTQPALYVINALSYYQKGEVNADYLIGHSLGEYNALLAAEAFDFETGLRLVKRRGELMAEASGGGMAAVLGLNAKALQDKLEEGKYNQIDIANFNTPSQIVIAGPQNEINRVIKDFDYQNIKIIPLFVTAPFHSRYMNSAAEEFSFFLKNYEFSPLKTTVISNVTGLPYQNNNISELLSKQISSPVHWINMIRLLMGKGVTEYEEVNSVILTKMVAEIRDNCSPIEEDYEKSKNRLVNDFEKQVTPIATSSYKQNGMKKKSNLSTQLGSLTFRKAYDVNYAYVTGAMYRGIASKELVVRMARAKMLSFLGTGGMPLEEIEKCIHFIHRELINGESFGLNLLHNLINPDVEMETVKLYLKHNIKIIEAAAFMRITPAIVYYRLKGLSKNKEGRIICNHHIMAKVSRPEVAEAFMNPAPERVVNRLLDQGLISKEQAEISKMVPMSHDICVEADSGGHTDGGVALVLLPSIQNLRADIQKEFIYEEFIRIGLAGGIGTPQAVACAFIMGADFVLTGSINQCTVEAGMSDVVKDLLQDINVQDTDYAPAGDMFEIGAKVQVLKKGILFSTRANKLYRLYQQYNSLEEIPEKTIKQLEKSYFKKSISDVWEETKNYLINKGEKSVIKDAEQTPKKKMALVFRWYFGYSMRLSFDADIKEKVNFQVHTGPALGAFNQWVKGTELEHWKNRHSDIIGIKMMEGAIKIIENNFETIHNN